MDTRLRASPRHGGTRKFFLFFILLSHQSAAGAPLRGWRQSSYLNNTKGSLPTFSLDTLFFLGNVQHQAKRSTGVSPQPLAPLNAITLELGYVIIAISPGEV